MPRMVTRCVARRPISQPRKPAMIAPNKRGEGDDEVEGFHR